MFEFMGIANSNMLRVHLSLAWQSLAIARFYWSVFGVRLNPKRLRIQKNYIIIFVLIHFIYIIFFHRLSIFHHVGFLSLLTNDEISRAGSTIFYVKR